MKLMDTYLELRHKYKDYVIIIKNGNFYNVIGSDCYILEEMFNYKKVKISNSIKVGFPLRSLNKVINKLKYFKINYLIYEQEITRKKYKNNNYKNFIKSLSIDNRVNVITFKLNELKENSKTINILENIESNV